MISFEYIEKLFQAVADKSRTIKGRIYFAPKLGAELFGEDLSDIIKKTPTPIEKAYPLSLVLPPEIDGIYNSREGSEHWQMSAVFLDTLYYGDDNETNDTTGTSTTSIKETWQKMRIAAIDFLRVLDRTRSKDSKVYYMRDRGVKLQVVNLGQDRLAGVRITFFIGVHVGCNIEDYSEQDIVAIKLPEIC